MPTTPRASSPPPPVEATLPPPIPTGPAIPPIVSAPPSPPAAKPRALWANGSESSSDEDDEPNTEYAQLRLKLDSILGHVAGPTKGKKQKKGPPKKGTGVVQEPEAATKIRKRMEVVKAMYMYSEKESDAEYRALKQKADADLLEARLNGTLPTPVETPTPLDPSPELDSSLVDVFDTVLTVKDEEGEPEGLLSVRHLVSVCLSEIVLTARTALLVLARCLRRRRRTPRRVT